MAQGEGAVLSGVLHAAVGHRVLHGVKIGGIGHELGHLGVVGMAHVELAVVVDQGIGVAHIGRHVGHGDQRLLRQDAGHIKLTGRTGCPAPWRREWVMQKVNFISLMRRVEHTSGQGTVKPLQSFRFRFFFTVT